ncbi:MULTISPECIES: transcriptional regulator NrdR [Acetobacter]|uniref:Transcriptional repressor NrdR n=1 Tax=Acetobacter thailandicus TaxID=1502842 RepID=A0ABT3QG28_9PROT|nr:MULTISPECIES: transcriptional regulator NrdR [Acetobacter]MBS0959693.1 transcriptional repressor NrdR [Acetobacter thailandicus]MBS0979856.1 transcriptional repressor NrdR [Acetobacter thailandicus]MBS0985151.1 transcriptional repressor NrdR [Acetobacter thailandicus]MBS1002824.1 transcriptional repressor NrdR [Acetobacter thailandicus]MCX2564243.1 transcriptional regulator NrdR [Acetobacter thailandicus]
MRCPFCGNPDSQVKDSRPNEEISAIRRRRSCLSCGQRFTTVERVQLRELVVIKADGQRAPFEREKLARSIRIALRKRPVPDSRIEQIVTGIVGRLEASGEGEIDSALIGSMAMDVLRDVDTVGYVRFASVYRDFTEAKDFSEILTSMDKISADFKEKD